MPKKADSAALDSLTPLVISGSPWAIRPDVLPRVAEASRLAALGREDLVAYAEHLAKGPQAARLTRGGARAGASVAVIPLTGILTPRGSLMSYLFGGGFGGLHDFRETFADAVNSPDVGAIVLDVDSPGGLTGLVPETAADIRAARGTKPIVAVANTQAASAAYWIAAQADELVVTPSGSVGSVGVYIPHESWAEYLKQAGIEVTYISAGRFKTDGNADEPLSESAREDFQLIVDHIYDMFAGDVAEGRGISVEDVKANYGEGRSLRAQHALAAGMVDRIATLETVISELITGERGGANAAAGTPDRIATLETVISELITGERGGANAAAGTPDAVAVADDPAAVTDPDPEAVTDPDPDSADEPKPVVDREFLARHAAVLFSR